MTAVAMKCEMMLSGNQPIIGWVSIVCRYGGVLFSESVKPSVVVTDYRTHITGLIKAHLDTGKSLSVVQRLVANLIKDKILVGYNLQNELNALGLSHPECKQRDLAKYEPFMENGQPQSLKELAKKHLSKIFGEDLDYMTDVRIIMKLYNTVVNNWNLQYFDH